MVKPIESEQVAFSYPKFLLDSYILNSFTKYEITTLRENQLNQINCRDNLSQIKEAFTS